MFKILARIYRTGRLSERIPRAELSPAAGSAVQQELYAVFGRALCIRHVDAGSCNGCELEIHALGNPFYNIEGAGIRFVASPRHADLLLVTGPVSINMEQALKLAYEAVPEPKWVIAVGDCAAGCGVFDANYACRGRVGDVIPVDAIVSGCPPTPLAMLQAIREVVGQCA
ncbi:MAG: formate hydrogenlyase [Rhodanobacteraceae bacterium]